MTVRGRPLGVLLTAALLLVLALRSAVRLVGDQLLQGYLGPVDRVVAVTILIVAPTGAIGLLLRQRWARWLALGVCTGYGVLLIVGLISALFSHGLDGIGIGRVLFTVLEAVVFAGAAWWYVTRPEVKALFVTGTD